MRKIKKMILLAALGLFGLLLCLPVALLLSGGLMGDGELGRRLAAVSGSGGYVEWRLLPDYPTLKNYVKLLLDSPEFYVMFWNSVRLTAGTLLGQLLFGVPAAWAFAKCRLRGKKLLFGIYLLLMILPFQVTQLSQYLALQRLGLMNTQAGVILLGAFSTYPVFLMYRFFEGIPETLLEAARVDGANSWQLFRYIGLPLGAGGIISAMVLSFLEVWSMVEQPMTFLKDKSLWPLSLYLPGVGWSEAGTAFATSVVVLIPALLVFFCGHRHLEQGIAASGLKD